MKHPLKSLFTLSIVLVSCNDDELRNLESENWSLNNKVDQLQSQISELSYQLENNQNAAKSSNSRCEMELREYRYGALCSIERMTSTGYVKVYGAENVIDFLNDHYCTHFEFVVSQDDVRRSQRNPRIIR